MPSSRTRLSPVWRRTLSAGLLTAALALGGCAAMTAQNPSGALKPVNAMAVGEQTRVMLAGADVVAYFTQSKFVKGVPQFQSTHEGVVFHFASAEHKQLFDAAPAKYFPQYGGYCANGLVYGIPWGGDADTWKLVDGRLFIFGGQGSKDAFLLDEKANIALADRYWQQEVSGSNSFVQRAKRLVFKVPHYKSGDELAKAVAAAQGSKP
ncbi:MAG TPA: YHS domain-containing (seleno)protein [Burkholderiaceae bacterium]|nr:YHS domain-containing (seleno)protein [Burkholderiaceae bacterium]